MESTVIVTTLVLVQFVYFGISVGKARGRYGINVPTIVGNPDFERVFRAHQNTMEQLILFLPALWMFSFYVHELTGAALGVMYLITRHIYFFAYARDSAKRSKPFIVGFVITAILLLGGVTGAVIELVGARLN